MSDAMRIGSSALLAYQRSLSVLSHNVANAGVDGFSRQRTELQAQIGSGGLGLGVTVTGVNRLVDVYANSRLIDDASGLGHYRRTSDIAARVDRLLSDSAGGLGGAIDAFFAAVRDVEADPTNLAARETLLSAGADLASRSQSLHHALNALEKEVEERAAASVADVNTLTRRIADLNRQITMGSPPSNDLLDQRDAAVRELAGQIGVRTAMQDGNVLNVYTADGHALVLGTETRALSLVPDPADSRRTQLQVGSGGGAVIIGAPVGGELGGLYAARKESIDPVRGSLGAIAGSLAQAVNLQQSSGTDLDGNAGEALFSLGQPVARAHASNSGGASVALALDPTQPVADGRYELRYQGGSWNLRDLGSGESIALAGSGSAADPFRAAGLTLVVGGTPAENDRYLLTPGADVLAGLKALPADARGVAAAAPLLAEADAGNAGNVMPGGVAIVDPSDPAARLPAEIEFLGAGNVSINGGAAQPINADGSVDGPGWRLQLSGSPQAGDRIHLVTTPPGSRDNGNALAMAGLGSAPITASGRSVGEAYSDRVAKQGTVARQAESAREAQSRMHQQNVAAREAASGVNLDEEAANLLRLQQAYQAAAQVMSTADSLFQTLIGALRR